MNPTNTINVGPVFSAGMKGTIADCQSALPSMRATVLGWFKPLVIGVVSTVIADEGEDDGLAQVTVREVRTSGVIQPGDDERLDVRSEGERSWESAILHVFPQLDVPTGTKLRINGRQFEVMGKKDYVQNGFIRYKLTQAFQ